MSLRIIFAGTPSFTLPALTALLKSEHEVCAVFTKPDSHFGRGRQLSFSAVKSFLLDQHSEIPIFQPASLKTPEAQAELKRLAADVMIVIAYGLILPPEVIAIPTYGCINIHASLLPKWRGAAPIQRAILAGDQRTGVTIMQIDAGLDTGDILLKKECEILATDTSSSLHERLAYLGTEALLEVLSDIKNYQQHATPQNEAEATHAHKITKEEGSINWKMTARQIDQQVRAFNPWPIAHTLLNGEVLRVWQTRVTDQLVSSPPGKVIALGPELIGVATGSGRLDLLKVQLANGKILNVSDFLNARRHWFAQDVFLGS